MANSFGVENGLDGLMMLRQERDRISSHPRLRYRNVMPMSNNELSFVYAIVSLSHRAMWGTQILDGSMFASSGNGLRAVRFLCFMSVEFVSLFYILLTSVGVRLSLTLFRRSCAHRQSRVSGLCRFLFPFVSPCVSTLALCLLTYPAACTRIRLGASSCVSSRTFPTTCGVFFP